MEKPEVKEQPFVLKPRRLAVKVGMPTDGMWIIAGLPKSGKTTLAASIPNGVVLELEKGGADRIEGWIQDIPDMALFRKAFMAAVKEPTVRAIIIDTLDVVLDNLEEEVAAQFGLENMSDRKEGVNGFAVWAELSKRVAGMVATFKECGKLVVLLAHFKEPRLDSEGRLVITNAINAPGKVGSYFASHAEAIGICSKKSLGSGKMQYQISFEGGGPLGTFGNRVSEFEGRTITLPKDDPWTAIEDVFRAKPVKEIEPSKSEVSTNGKGRKRTWGE